MTLGPIDGWVLVTMFVALTNVLPWDASSQQDAAPAPVPMTGTGPG